MPEVRQTARYRAWFDSLRDRQAKARINVRIRRLQEGNPGQHRQLAAGVLELKIDYGPGYRLPTVLQAARKRADRPVSGRRQVLPE